MESTEIEIGSLKPLIHQLRVPELKYSQQNIQTTERIDSFEHLYKVLFAEKINSNEGPEGAGSNAVSDEDVSILSRLSNSGYDRQVPLVLNAAFFSDRVFDVWLRKNKLNPELNQRLNFWRFPFFTLVLKHLKVFQDSESEKLDSDYFFYFRSSLDLLVQSSNGWSPLPERSKYAMLDFFDGIYLGAIEGLKSNGSFPRMEERISEFCAKKDAKFKKVVDRLVSSEVQKIQNQYKAWWAQNYINEVFAGKKLPESLQVFIDTYWTRCVSASLVGNENEGYRLDSSVDETSFILRDVFCVQSNALFEHADNIIDDLKASLSKASILCDSVIWNALEESLVSLLKQEFSEAHETYLPVAPLGELAEQFGVFNATLHADNKGKPRAMSSLLNMKEGEWYDFSESDLQSIPMYLAKSFKESGFKLFVNHVGMKVGLFSDNDLNVFINSRKIKPTPEGEDFVTVCNSVIKGLKRVADTQQKQRLEAAQKAKEEAERLLEQQRLAEEEANRKAQEIAQRTKELLQKREDKKRAEQVAKALELVQGLSVGAWVDIGQSDKQRHKLVVKIAASGKYIFVDKLGIRKKEFVEDELVKAFVSKEITYVSDGAEFEDSLQRVVSRIRVNN